MFRICSEFSVMFRICSESVQNFQQCSESVQNLFRIFSNVQNLFRIFSNVQNFQNLFRIFSNVQNLFRIFRNFSDFLAQKLVYSESLGFVVPLDRINLFNKIAMHTKIDTCICAFFFKLTDACKQTWENVLEYLK